MKTYQTQDRPASVVHILAGLGLTSGVANAARRFARVQRDAGRMTAMLAPTHAWNPIFFSLSFAVRAWRAVRRTDEVWVHCSWTFPVWFGAWLARRRGCRLVVVPSGSFDPVRMNNRSGWKKRFVAPLDRWVLRMADEVLALCPDEVDWIRAFEPRAKVRRMRVPLFAETVPAGRVAVSRGKDGANELHVLFLGRAEDPLKGVRFLEQAVCAVNAERNREAVKLRIVRDHTGEELEADWRWCDVLCLPTLSENFGLVVAEALERGTRVITTDGASAWMPEGDGAAEGDPTRTPLVCLRGFRNGTDAMRVLLLKNALVQVCSEVMS